MIDWVTSIDYSPRTHKRETKKIDELVFSFDLLCAWKRKEYDKCRNWNAGIFSYQAADCKTGSEAQRLGLLQLIPNNNKVSNHNDTLLKRPFWIWNSLKQIITKFSYVIEKL